MKALELTVYPPIPPDPYEFGRLMYNDPEVTAWENARYEEDVAKFRKRLTDAELAAEYHAMDSKCRHEQWIETVRGDDDYEDWERAMQSRMYEQLTALHRFATLPNYDEDQP